MARKQGDLYSGLIQMCLAALTGHARFSVTLGVYAIAAVVLLGYVTAQVYTGVLTEEIRELRQERVTGREEFNKLTSHYVTLSSRESVVGYCEAKLGMIPAEEEVTARVAVEDQVFTFPLEFTKRESALPDLYRYSMNRKLNESIR